MKALVLAVLALVLVHRYVSQPSKALMSGEGNSWFLYHRDGGGV